MKWLVVAILVLAFIAIWPVMHYKRGWFVPPILIAAGVAAYILNGWKFY